MSEKPSYFITAGGVEITRTPRLIAYEGATLPYIQALDERRGAVLSSNYEYPGRYARWDMAFIDPPLLIEARGASMRIKALNARGAVLLDACRTAVREGDDALLVADEDLCLQLAIKPPAKVFLEEERSRQPSVFSVLRRLLAHFSTQEDGSLGFYGAFGYDLAFQFEPILLKQQRPEEGRDLVLYLPDEILIVDHYRALATVYSYDFKVGERSTSAHGRTGERIPFTPARRVPERGDHKPGEYAALVEKAKEAFRRGDLFEVVPGQTFYERASAPPSAIARQLQETNPSPYGFFFNLGNQEYLVGASPEMYVRVTGGRRVETCPISGTIRRGRDAMEDEAQIRALLNSKKDEAELTMCSDVDRNDKSRVCEPGSVRLIGRRQIEMYSRLIHTVDHIEGRLRADMDALDAFLSHAWAVTVTGAPKRWAMQFIEDHEKSPRAWYGGAVGALLMNGDLNTGLTLRTIRIHEGLCEVRAGATLLYDSDPMEEEKETELKAAAMLAAIRNAGMQTADAGPEKKKEGAGKGLSVLLIDHEDSFVHTLANYFRQTGAEVVTIRAKKGYGVDPAQLAALRPDLVVLSPGPGTPADFLCARTIGLIRENGTPIFGVCLGLQALVEAFGGTLSQLAVPMHGKPSTITVQKNSILFKGLPENITVGRYHSLHAVPDDLPSGFTVTAQDEQGVIMAIEHESEPLAAVQFHPESIMSLADQAGHLIIDNALRALALPPKIRTREAG